MSNFRFVRSTAKTRMRLFKTDRSGSIAVEFAFAIPIFLMFLVGIIQFGGYFVLHQEMTRTAREAVRGLALGAMTEGQAIAQVQDKLSGWAASFTVTATLDDDATVFISVPYEDAALVSFFHSLQSGTLKAKVTMRSEV